MTNNYHFIFKLEIVGGLALIQKEVYADYYEIKEGTYIFHSRDKKYCEGIISQYPVVNTIISSIDENEDYKAPQVNEDYGALDYGEGGHF